MDEDCAQLELFSTFTSSSFLRWTTAPRRWTPHRALSSIYRRGCILHQHFHLQFLHSIRLCSPYSMRRRPKVQMKIADAHYKTILFYEAHAAHVEFTTLLTPSKLNSGGVESRSRSRSSSFLQTAGLWTRFFSMILSTSACVGTYEDSDGHPQSTFKQRAPSSIYRRWCMLHHHFSSSDFEDPHSISAVGIYPVSKRPRFR